MNVFWAGAFRLIEIVGRISAMIPVSRGGTQCTKLITERETHLFVDSAGCKSVAGLTRT